MSSEWIGLDQILVQREVDEAELAAIAFLARYSGRTLRRIGRIFASSSRGRRRSASRSSQRHARTSTCSAITWNRAAWQHRRSIVVAFVAGA